MKKVLFIAILTIIALSSCGKEEPKQTGIQLNKTDVSLKHGETFKLVVSNATGSETFSSENKYIATVDGAGSIKAGVIGETSIIVKRGIESATCKVMVIPAITNIDEPYLRFGADKQTVKNIIKKYGTVTDKPNSLFVSTYIGGNTLTYMYNFENNKLVSAAMSTRRIGSLSKSLIEFYLERYIVVKHDGNTILGITPDEAVVVGVQIDDLVTLGYIPK